MYWHHQTIKKNTIAIMDLFNDIEVPRYDSNGNIISFIKVPIEFGNRDKLMQYLDQSNKNLVTGNVMSYPRMALSFTGLTKAANRDTNKTERINKLKDSKKVQFQFNARAYDFNYTLFIATRTLTDMTIIVEQIAPLFRPSITLQVKEIDIQDVPTNLVLELGDFNFDLPDTLEAEDIRIVQVDVSLVLRGNLYLPLKDIKLIDDFRIYIGEGDLEDLASKTIRYGIDAEIIVKEPKNEINHSGLALGADEKFILPEGMSECKM